MMQLRTRLLMAFFTSSLMLAGSVTQAAETLFSVDGTPKSDEHLSPGLQQALFDARLQHYKEQLKIIDEALFELAVERQAKANNASRESVLESMLAVPAPSAAEIVDFYNQNKSQIPYPLNAVRHEISRVLIQQSTQQKKAEIVARFKSDSIVDVTMKKPIAPVTELAIDGLPSKGNTNAKITLVEFADYQCPHCKQAAGVLRTVAERFPTELRIVFMDLPINPSGISRIIAEGAACADQQGQFWAFHDLAFEHQLTLSKESVAQFVSELDLDVSEFERCMTSEFPQERVAKSERQASELGLTSTPTLFLNGRKLHLHDMNTELVEAIEALLEDGSDA